MSNLSAAFNARVVVFAYVIRFFVCLPPLRPRSRVDRRLLCDRNDFECFYFFMIFKKEPTCVWSVRLLVWRRHPTSSRRNRVYIPSYIIYTNFLKYRTLTHPNRRYSSEHYGTVLFNHLCGPYFDCTFIRIRRYRFNQEKKKIPGLKNKV